MRRSYAAEINELPVTYGRTLSSSVAEEMGTVLGHNGPMVFVGSGGALAAARLAADLHIHATGHMASAMTPLEASTSHLSPQTGVVLFSARARNPDAALTIRTAKLRGAVHLGVVSTRGRESLPKALASEDLHIAALPSSPDGFLATNSLIAMVAGVCMAHGVDLPPFLPAFSENYRGTRDSVVAVTGPGVGAVALDLEARFFETGLATVQLADYRNLAHGRHVGLERNAERSTVVAVVDPTSEVMASLTLAVLPPSIDVLMLRTTLEWPSSVVDLLVASIKVVGSTARSAGLDPGRPGVPSFGRKLYRLSLHKAIDIPKPDPVEKKLLRRSVHSAVRASYKAWLDMWLDELKHTDIGSVVLDYDGTVVSTTGRFDPPVPDVQAQIIRLLEAGVVVSFATGRGKSLHDTMRKWMPEEFWSHISVGLYNGSCILRLDEDPPSFEGCGGHLSVVADRLEEIADTCGLSLERRRTQVSISDPEHIATGEEILPVVRSVLARSPIVDLKVVVSGHSVDIVAAGTGKVTLISSVESESQGAILAIGDQGQPNGNDFEMLAVNKTTLSVDRCSADPTRCWNLDDRGDCGPDLLLRYLRALKPRKSGVRFVWRNP